MAKDELAPSKKIVSELSALPAISVSLQSPTDTEPLPALKGLLSLIRDRSKAISFENYSEFMDRVMGCSGSQPSEGTETELRSQWDKQLYRSTDAYSLLKASTEAFLKQECGVLIEEWEHAGTPEEADEERKRLPQLSGKSDADVKKEIEANRDEYLKDLERENSDIKVIPYFKRIIDGLQGIPLKYSGVVPPNCYGILRSKITEPCLLELIWSYWHEEGMLVQSLNAISLRFQNRRGFGDHDPLGEFELDPLRPLNNIMWGYIQDEQHRLSLVRRAYEYDHHYGLRLYGKALPEMRTADSRSNFLEAFHALLNQCAFFYKEASDMTKRPDGYPLLNALKEVHLLLAQGAHNQYGDLPWTARAEMLMQQWVLARPELREFLRGRHMIPYPEPWMGSVDAMKKLQSWTDVTVRYFRDLGVFGEQILLSIRFADWSNVNDELEARVWAQYFKEEIMGYIHAYRTVTGVDLSVPLVTGSVNATLPSILIRERLLSQRRA